MTRQTCIYFKSFFNNYTLLLPVKLLSFSAQAVSSGNLLSWSASSESDVAGYTLQRSADGRNWQDLQLLAPGKEAINHYQITDNEKAGPMYYRLCITGRTGVKQFSKTIQVERNLLTGISFLPAHFAANGVSIQFSTLVPDNYEFSLWTMNGQRLSKRQGPVHAGSNSLVLDAGSSTVPGMYLLTVKNSRGELIHQAKLFRN